MRTEGVDGADAVSLRPDLTVLMYPVATMSDPHVHAGSREHLLGASPSPERVAAFSLERMNWAGAAPVFLLHAMDDASVPVENSTPPSAALRVTRAVSVKLRPPIGAEAWAGMGDIGGRYR